MKKSEIKAGAILSYIILGIELIIGLVYIPILTKSLGQSEYGVYSLISSIMTYLALLDCGFASAIIVYTAKYRVNNEIEKEQKLHGMFLLVYIVIGLIVGILGYILYINVDNLFGKTMTFQEIKTAKTLILVLVGNLVITFPMSIFGSIITAHEKFIFANSLTAIRVIICPLIAIPLLLIGYKSFMVAILTTIINIIILTSNMLYCIKKLKIRFNFRNFKFKLLGEIFIFSFFIFLNEIVDKVNYGVDQFIIGSIVGAKSVAIYNISGQINTIYLSFATTITTLLLPRTTQMETKKVSDKDFSEYFILVGRILYIVVAIVVTGFVLFGKEFMILWQGNEYKQSYYIASILMVSATLPLIQHIGVIILRAKNKHKFRTITLAILAMINIIISIPLTKLYGGIGAAMGTALTMIAGPVIVMNIYYYKKIHINIPIFWKVILKMSIPMIGIFVIGMILNRIFITSNLLILFIKIAIYSIIYILGVWKFIMNDYEKKLFIKPINQIISKIRKNKSEIDELS